MASRLLRVALLGRRLAAPGLHAQPPPCRCGRGLGLSGQQRRRLTSGPPATGGATDGKRRAMVLKERKDRAVGTAAAGLTGWALGKLPPRLATLW